MKDGTLARVKPLSRGNFNSRPKKPSYISRKSSVGIEELTRDSSDSDCIVGALVEMIMNKTRRDVMRFVCCGTVAVILIDHGFFRPDNRYIYEALIPGRPNCII
jgi:hypothetical protein